jgi:hypothetical protein
MIRKDISPTDILGDLEEVYVKAMEKFYSGLKG